MRRFRRLRASEEIRSLVQETRLSAKELIYPVFVKEGENIKAPVDSMPGIYQWSPDRFDEELERISASGIAGLLIFGIPEHKDELATEAYSENGIFGGGLDRCIDTDFSAYDPFSDDDKADDHA